MFPKRNKGNDTIDLESLYEAKKTRQENELKVYNKLLSRIHNRIKITARKPKAPKYLFFPVPHIMLGEINYDLADCIIFLMECLQENGFDVKYTKPNVIFISWEHYIPSYERERIKHETGVKIDGFGNRIEEKNKKDDDNPFMFKDSKQIKKEAEENKDKKDYKDVSTYKPSGVYNEDIFNRLKKTLG
jgi:hypothetical protein